MKTKRNIKLRPEHENSGVQKKQFFSLKNLSNVGRLLLWLLSTKECRTHVFSMISAFHTMAKKNGTVFLVQYLKESHRLTLKALSGSPEKCITSPRVATRAGIPLIIPPYLRYGLYRRDKVIVQLVLTLLNFYRVIKIKASLKINTITDKFGGLSPELPILEVKEAIKVLRLKYNFVINSNADLIPSVSAGPNSRISILGVTIDAWAFTRSPELLVHYRELAKTLGPDLLILLEKEIEFLPVWLSQLKEGLREKLLSRLKLGKLSEKLEAAGKVRVFAITDVWTQSLLKPLHDAILRALSHIPMDGTYDQLKPIRILYEKGHTEFYSFDLTAATDRLPIQLQIQVLSLLTNENFALAWAGLLTKRPWYHKFVPYFYEVGQPMGALSSWGMLALTHHVIVQVAARRVGKSNFSDYAVLGDDLVIADKAVADAYLVIAKDLGIEINLFKSLMSKTSVSEFAKRLFSEDGDLSPLPPKLLFSLLRGLRNLPAVVRDMVGRGLQAQTEVLLSDKAIKPQLLWEMIGPLGFLDSSGLSPFLENSLLEERNLKVLCQATVNVINRKLIKTFYESQNSLITILTKTVGLVYDDMGIKVVSPEKIWEEGQYMAKHYKDLPSTGLWDFDSFPVLPTFREDEEGGFVEGTYLEYPTETPALMHIADCMIDKVKLCLSTKPSLIEMPSGPFTIEQTSLFIRESFNYLDSIDNQVPDITQRVVPSSRGKGYYSFYRDLDAEYSRLPYEV